MAEIPSRPHWTAWAGPLGVALVLCGAVLSTGDLVATVHGNTDKIHQLETRIDSREDKLNTIDLRTARMEAKLEMMTTERRP